MTKKGLWHRKIKWEPGPQSDFSLFDQLPAGLRLKVWDLVAGEKRIAVINKLRKTENFMNSMSGPATYIYALNHAVLPCSSTS
jgi:hypothetical protein